MSRYLITSALPYINGIKHLGNLIGSMLPADVTARYRRLQGHEVLCICATDEHGTPAELAAAEAGLPVAEYCERQHVIQKQAGEQFQLSFDYFGRTSSKQNHQLTQHFALQLGMNGYLEERQTKQVYSVADGRFLPDRYVIGTCPHCGYDNARGDQCENCTRPLDPTDLKNARSAISGSQDLEVRETRHLFLLQSRLVAPLREWIESHPNWPPLVSSIALKWLNEGLHDRSITRDLSWGVPVDRPGFEHKVFYVWFDAPIGYIGATAQWADQDPSRRNYRDWWYDANDVTYLQFMAKDNIPFHTIGFPATLIASGEPWKQVDYIKGFNWMSYYGGKFSTSRKRGIFMDQALELLPADYWRWYLIANAPESSDSDFTWEGFAGTVNKDLADVFGNLVNRCLRFISSKFGDLIPAGGEMSEAEMMLASELDQAIVAYNESMSELQFRRAAQQLRRIWVIGNAYVDHMAPWTTIKTDRDRSACILRTSVNLIRICAILAQPILPATSETLMNSLQLDPADRGWISGDALSELRRLVAGRPFTTPPLLFRKIQDAEIEEWKGRFGAS